MVAPGIFASVLRSLLKSVTHMWSNGVVKTMGIRHCKLTQCDIGVVRVDYVPVKRLTTIMGWCKLTFVNDRNNQNEFKAQKIKSITILK